MPTPVFTSDTVEQLAEQLTRTAPGDLNYAYFVSGGSEAVETALKLARQYFVELGQPSRTKFIARKQSYHGNTLGALAVGGNEWRRRQFAPLLIDVIRVSACNEYRDRRADETQQQYTTRLLNELEHAILEAGPETIIGFCAETVVGATTGATPLLPAILKGYATCAINTAFSTSRMKSCVAWDAPVRCMRLNRMMWCRIW